MREASRTLIASWRRRGRLLGFGAGIAQGYALGQIGFADRSGYTAIGTVCNLAARLCAEAQDGQILIGQRVAVAIEETTSQNLDPSNSAAFASPARCQLDSLMDFFGLAVNQNQWRKSPAW
jgi:class 3 adenylate cyclase